jgi:urease accessory protein
MVDPTIANEYRSEVLRLLLADSRLPAGGHAHSLGVESAVNVARVTDTATLHTFIVERLNGSALTAASFAAATVALMSDHSPVIALEQLRVELTARTPSQAQRRASMNQARALLRITRTIWPDVVEGAEWAIYAPLALGVTVYGAGLTAADAALLSVQGSVNQSTSAALRLLGLDPVHLVALHVELAPLIADIAEQANNAAAEHATAPESLPALGLPLLDVRAEIHARQEVRLFAS